MYLSSLDYGMISECVLVSLEVNSQSAKWYLVSATRDKVGAEGHREKGFDEGDAKSPGGVLEEMSS
jgi:hypothetical protein